jgi:hypothetical protein
MNEHAVPADPLGGFISTAKGRGVPDDALVPLLRQNGWSERRVYRSLSAYYTGALGVAPPSRGGRGVDARDAFLYLLNFITLGFWVVALGQLFTILIDRRFPDPAMSSGYALDLIHQIAWQLATIIVAFPCFALIGRMIGAELARRPESADSGVRAWLTYIALVIAGVCVLSDAIWVLEAFLTGTLTIRFVLDSIVVIGLGGGVFAYYLATLRPAEAVDR